MYNLNPKVVYGLHSTHPKMWLINVVLVYLNDKLCLLVTSTHRASLETPCKLASPLLLPSSDPYLSISYPYPYRPSYPSSGKVSKHIVRLRTQRLPQPQRSKGLSREGGQGTGGGRTEGPRRLATTNILQQLLQRDELKLDKFVAANCNTMH